MRLIRITVFFTFPVLIACANPNSSIYDESQIEDIFSDYFRLEEPQCHVCNVYFIENGKSVRTFTVSELEQYGFQHEVHGCVSGSGSILLSIKKQEESEQLELRTIEGGSLCFRKIWYYPIFSEGSKCAIKKIYEGEIITFEIQKNREILFDGRDIGLGGVQAMTRMIKDKNEGPIRFSIVIEKNAPKELESFVKEEIMTADPTARIITRHESYPLFPNIKNEQNKSVLTTPEASPPTS